MNKFNYLEEDKKNLKQAIKDAEAANANQYRFELAVEFGRCVVCKEPLHEKDVTHCCGNFCDSEPGYEDFKGHI